MNDVAREMPKYRCHKEVWALKIARIDEVSGSYSGEWMITPEDAGYGPFIVTANYVLKHQPEVGGFYVVYEDGYASYSPAAAFEAGYSLIEEGQ